MRRVITVAAIMLATVAAAGQDLKTLEAEFKATCQKMVGAKLRKTPEHVIGRDGWVVLTTELNYAASGQFWGEGGRKANPKAAPDAADPLPAILDFDRQLKARGITLIFMPVPTRVVVYPEAIVGKERLADFKTPPHLHTPERELFGLLRTSGVGVVELTPIFLANHAHPRAPLFIPSESHWTPAAISIAARELALKLKGLPSLAAIPKATYTEGWKAKDHVGHIYKELHQQGGLPLRDGDRVWLRYVKNGQPGDKSAPERRHPESPVVLIGDSNTVWWEWAGSSLPQQLAAELGFEVDVLSTTGGGATNTRLNFVRTALSEEGFLARKKVVIWCFTSRSFFNSHDGWKIIPLERPAAADASP